MYTILTRRTILIITIIKDSNKKCCIVVTLKRWVFYEFSKCFLSICIKLTKGYIKKKKAKCTTYQLKTKSNIYFFYRNSKIVIFEICIFYWILTSPFAVDDTSFIRVIFKFLYFLSLFENVSKIILTKNIEHFIQSSLYDIIYIYIYIYIHFIYKYINIYILLIKENNLNFLISKKKCTSI
jgi:hypothetical protein